MWSRRRSRLRDGTALLLAAVLLGPGCGGRGGSVRRADRLVSAAAERIRDGDLAGAEERLGEAARILPANPRIRNNLAGVLARRGAEDRARRIYEAALREVPGYVVARRNLAVLSLKHGEVRGAEEELRRALRSFPESPGLHNALGVCLLRRGDVHGAMEAFRKAVDLGGFDPDAYNNLAYAYAEANAYLNEARKLVGEALAREPENAAYLDTLGWIYFKRGVFDRAVAELRKALERAPGDATVRRHLVRVYRWTGRTDEALALIREGAARSGPGPDRVR